MEGDFPAALEAAAQLQHVLTASPEAAALASAAGPLPGTTPPATGADAYCVRAHVPLPPVGSLAALIGTLKELQKLKEEGNEAVRVRCFGALVVALEQCIRITFWSSLCGCLAVGPCPFLHDVDQSW